MSLTSYFELARFSRPTHPENYHIPTRFPRHPINKLCRTYQRTNPFRAAAPYHELFPTSPLFRSEITPHAPPRVLPPSPPPSASPLTHTPHPSRIRPSPVRIIRIIRIIPPATRAPPPRDPRARLAARKMVSNPWTDHLHPRPHADFALARKQSDPFLVIKQASFPRHYPKAALRIPWHRRRWTLFACLVFFCWIFLTADSFFLSWLKWLIRSPVGPDASLINDCPARNYSLPMVVVMPLISTQFNRLEWNVRRWLDPQFHPCPSNFSGHKPHLSFFFDRPLEEPNTAAAADAIHNLLDQPQFHNLLAHCFSAVTVTSANLTEAQTRNSYTMDMVHNLVRTAGSNRLFEGAFTTFGGGHFRHMFWMEPDAYPIRSGWLNAVVTESTWGDFWMRGSSMRHVPRFNIGLEPYRSRYQRHINGNAIYALDDSCFARYRQMTRQTYGDGAFDVAMNLYLLGMNRIRIFQSVGHRFQQSRVIADVGVSMIDTDNTEGVREEFPGTFLIHGKASFVRYPLLNFMQY